MTNMYKSYQAEAEKKFIDIAAAKEVLTDDGYFLIIYFLLTLKCLLHIANVRYLLI